MTSTRNTTLADLDDAVADATPELSEDDRRLVASIYRRLASGRPARPIDVASDADVPVAVVRDRLERWPGIYRDDEGDVIGFWGLALEGMPHRMAFTSGADVTAWCAWDPLFIAPIAGQARVETTDPVSGTAITYVVDGEGIHDPDPAHVVSFLEPTGRWDEDVLGSFCHYVLHFTSRETGERWTAERPDTFLLPLSDAAELGRRHARRIAGG